LFQPCNILPSPTRLLRNYDVAMVINIQISSRMPLVSDYALPRNSQIALEIKNSDKQSKEKEKKDLAWLWVVLLTERGQDSWLCAIVRLSSTTTCHWKERERKQLSPAAVYLDSMSFDVFLDKASKPQSTVSGTALDKSLFTNKCRTISWLDVYCQPVSVVCQPAEKLILTAKKYVLLMRLYRLKQSKK